MEQGISILLVLCHINFSSMVDFPPRANKNPLINVKRPNPYNLASEEAIPTARGKPNVVKLEGGQPVYIVVL